MPFFEYFDYALAQVRYSYSFFPWFFPLTSQIELFFNSIRVGRCLHLGRCSFYDILEILHEYWFCYIGVGGKRTFRNIWNSNEKYIFKFHEGSCIFVCKEGWSFMIKGTLLLYVFSFVFSKERWDVVLGFRRTICLFGTWVLFLRVLCRVNGCQCVCERCVSSVPAHARLGGRRCARRNGIRNGCSFVRSGRMLGIGPFFEIY